MALHLLAVPFVPSMASFMNSGKEASYWAARVGAQGAAPAIGAPPRPYPPVFESHDWWAGEALSLSDEVAKAPEAARALDPCWYDAACDCWQGAEECSVDETTAPPSFVRPSFVPDTDTFDLSVPCITTDEGCTLEARAGVAGSAAVPSPARETTSPSMDPCFWDEGCTAFA